jgi:transposase-like protein
MIIPYDFKISPQKYAKLGKKNKFPLIDQCPRCKAFGYLNRHGFYYRYVITEKDEFRIPICRLRCSKCKKTFSILPDFLIPYFKHTTQTILGRLRQYLREKKVMGSRQLLAFYMKRYLKNLHWVHSFFVDLGNVWGFSKDMMKEAIRYIDRILNFDERLFFRSSWGYLSSYFMAK